ncbi:DNA mismatch repair endonuclease MutL [Shewanella sp. AS16]|uniref:DNA mismatch repair endonuclease MutL n=1 Tax=Shewanella sp. AS16 TaxID=2907625 RepID=UPI001F348C28|nr:DNA mismatch repair endonuclease MutL [Shewanella sp. AS16]MCE9687029.1 DNA mismatch repair endonuclease MutL [Shewanella sp. AS16]
MGIQILPPQLANQIAAGEVVERPASVVKELVENSLDAGATRVDIEIDKGGSKLIRIRDNGVGIPKDELSLALSRHATSKLHSLDDLEAILSFGFRGEALASISSVSRLTLTSNTAGQSEAWQAYAEGSQMAVRVIPAAHPIGSTIEVIDLFFNTPARRRFLKSDKTEFTHIDEWLKRIALVRGEIHFTLSHNGKLVRNYRPALTQAQYLQRLAQVSDRHFAEQALRIECEHDGLRLSGYLQSPLQTKATETHYFYVNGRLVRDRLVNHAVRQAFAGQAQAEQPAYVLMLDLDPHQVDVNVHPAKHEVRFHQGRYIHDYILQALQSALEQAGELALSGAVPALAEAVAEPVGEYLAQVQGAESAAVADAAPEAAAAPHTWVGSAATQVHASPHSSAARHASQSRYGSMELPGSGGYSGGRSATSGQQTLPSQSAIASYGALLTTPSASCQGTTSAAQTLKPAGMPPLLGGRYWVLTQGEALSLLAVQDLALSTRKAEISAKLTTGLIGQPLLMPVSVAVDPDWAEILVSRETLIRQMGLELTIRYQQLIIKKVPPYLRDSQLATLIPEWLQWVKYETPTPEALVAWLAKQSLSGFISAPQIWSAYLMLDEQQQTDILRSAKALPWQSWLEEQASE